MLRRFGQLVAWAALLVIIALTAASIVGAFPQVDAPSMFNSAPMIVFWCVLLAMLLTGSLVFRRLRSPAALAMHLGSAMVLIGAMWGSQITHDLLQRPAPRSGFLVLGEGESRSELIDENHNSAGRLPFAIRLNDFTIEYYQSGTPWEMGVNLPPGPNDPHGKTFWLQWHVGADLDIPELPGKVQVLEYIPQARPAYAEGAQPLLEIAPVDREKVTIPAEVGGRITIDSPAMTIRITKKYSNLSVQDSPDGQVVIDAPGPASNPALAVEVELPDGEKSIRYISPRFPGHSRIPPRMRYLIPEISHAVADSNSDLPAMKVLFTAPDGRNETRWLIPSPGSDQAVISIAMALDQTAGTAPTAGESLLGLIKPMSGPVKDYKSDVEVIEEGSAVARKIVEVNDPLHYGGYHFYQHSHIGDDVSTLMAVSDAGLYWVWAGLTVMTAGIFWGMWIKPITARMRRGSGGHREVAS